VWAPYEAKWFAGIVKQMGHEPIVLANGDDVPDKYNDALKDAKGVFGVGHGNVDIFTGYALVPLEQVPVQPHKYDGKLFAPVSCLVGVELCPNIVQSSDNAAALGETVEYTFWLNPEADHEGDDPDKEDPLVASFLHGEEAFRRAIMQGKTLKEAHDEMVQEYYKQADYWDSQGWPEVASALRYDANMRQIFGDPNWSIGGQPPPPQPPPPPPQPPPQPPPPQPPQPPPPQPPPQPPQPQYVCPFCDFTTDTKDKLKQHILDVHLQPCKLSEWLRKKLNCPIEKLK
jgi:hypothetical protein